MTTIASQITSLAVVYSTVYSDADQRKHQSSTSLAFVWGIHRDRWIPRTKGQLRGKCFHLMTSSCEGNFTWDTSAINNQNHLEIYLYKISLRTPRGQWVNGWSNYTSLMDEAVYTYHHDDVIKWKHFPHYWHFGWEIQRSLVNSPHKGQWRGALMFSLICASNNWLSKQSWGWWFEMPSRLLWCHCKVLGPWKYTRVSLYTMQSFRNKIFCISQKPQR